MSTVLTSITGGNITERTPFIIIKLTLPNNLLYTKYENDKVIIYGINVRQLSTTLRENNIKPIFSAISDILYKKTQNKTIQFLVVNDTIKISKTPIVYEKIIKFGKGYIWKPVNITFPVIYNSLGMIYSKKQPVDDGRLIVSSILKNSDDILDNLSIFHLILSNEYNMFTTEYDSRRTIDLQKVMSLPSFNTINNFMAIDNNLTSQNNQTVEHVGNIVSNNSNINFLTEGRVEVDGKCIDDDLSMIDCVDAQLQQWGFENGNIVHMGSGKCLNTEHNSLVECDIKNHGNYIDKNEQPVQYPMWNKRTGRNIVLVSSDNPWYINTEDSEPSIIISDQNKNLHHTDYPKDYSIFKHDNLKIISETQPSVGVEPFNELSNDSHKTNKMSLDNVYAYIICVLLIIVVIQLVFLFRN